MVDPTGHTGMCGAFGPTPFAVACEVVTGVAGTPAGQQALQHVESLVVQYSPAVIQLLQQWGDKLPALVDQAGQLLNGSQQAASQAGNTADPGGLDPNKWGKWVERSESMSDRARTYQQFVTGRTDSKVYQVNGVHFDGVRDGVLLDAKGYYSQFVDPVTGRFQTWFAQRGGQNLVKEAQRQLEAARGVPIEWHFNEIETLNAMRQLLESSGINKGIQLIYTPMP
jgi:hypothetical protein